MHIPSPAIGTRPVDVKSETGARMTDAAANFLASLSAEQAADECLNRIEKAGRTHIHFARSGSQERGHPHYYRLHGPSFFAEYDNTQNDANHIHSVWRDVTNDWGEDLLKDHYRGSHRLQE
jgi:hypothetical protein